MSKLARKFVLVLLTVSVLLPGAPARANATREFVLSCTYGVIAGTMMGAATLAFSNKPSEHLYRVARGASLGLYAGILLGAYVTLIVPDGDELDDEAKAEAGLGWNRDYRLNSHSLSARMPELQARFEMRPMIEDRGISGASLHYSFHSF